VPVKSLEEYFGQHIECLKSLEEFKSVESVHDAILDWYDGYSWDGKDKLINPFSLLSFFSQERFESFWYASGSPKFLIDIIKNKPESFLSLKNPKIKELMLDNFNAQNIALEPLLFQTGYLSVKDVVIAKDRPQYILEIPNFEVSEAFYTQVVESLTESDSVRTDMAKEGISAALEAGDLQLVLDLLRGLFSSIPYQLHINEEAYYHSIFFAIMSVLGFEMEVEVSTSRGRVDAVLELDDKVYVIEFKYLNSEPDASEDEKRELFNKGLDDGMKQIMDRGYSDKYRGSGKAIYEAAFVFLGRDEIEFRMRWL
jgi:hypothetical protein